MITMETLALTYIFIRYYRNSPVTITSASDETGGMYLNILIG